MTLIRQYVFSAFQYSTYYLNPSFQFCTTAFLCEVAQYIKFGEIGSIERADGAKIDTGLESPVMPTLQIDRMPDGIEPGSDAELSKDEEDTILQNTCANFADWVAAFLRRVILLFENLPEEGGGQTECTVYVLRLP